MSIEISLSEVQRTIVEQPMDTPALLVDAGPGSGKTRVLGERIRWLLTQGAPAESIVALTFTQQAAHELRGRLLDVSTDVRAQTLHSYAHHVLRSNGKEWGRPAPVRVIAALEQVQALQRVFVDQFGWDCPESLASNVLKQISHRKRLGLEIGRHHYLFTYGHSQSDLERIDAAYCAENLAANCLDFDDLIAEAVVGLRNAPSGGNDRLWLFVDEFHDISLDQYELIRLIAPPARPGIHLFAIWDRRQSIYRFRGADTDRLAASLHADYSPLPLKMNENYRAAANLVQVAGSLLPRGRSPELVARRGPGGHALLVDCQHENAEADAIANLIEKRIAAGDPSGSIAVLYAKHERGDRIERVLTKRGIGVQRVLGRSLAALGPTRALETLLAFASGLPVDRRRFQDLSLELGSSLDELDWLGIAIDDHRRLILREAGGPSNRVARFNALLRHVESLPSDWTARRRGDAIIDSLEAADRERAAIPTADVSLPDRSFVAIDVESTSTYVESADIFDLAAIRFDASGNRLGEPFQAVIQGVRISPFVRKLTQITQQELDGGVEAGEAFARFREWIREEDVLVGHAITTFDLPLVNRHLYERGLPLLRNEVIDTLPIARRFYPQQSRRLEDLAEHFQFAPRPHHRALEDVETTIDLFKRLMSDRSTRLTNPAHEMRERSLSHWGELRRQWRRISDLAPADHTLADLLSMLALTGDDAHHDPDGAVQMMTIHASKGLEWQTVILAGIEDDLFPFGSNPSFDDLEEARRLLYVGVTRAMDRLAIFHTRHRDGVPKTPSRFLYQLPADPSIVYRHSTRRDTESLPN